MNDTTLGWNTKAEEPPSPDAPAADVSLYLWEMEGGGLVTWNGRPLSTREAREYCEAHGHPWKQVSPLLRELRAKDAAKHIESPVFETSAKGVVLNRSLLDALNDLRWLPMCPRVLTGWSNRDFFSHFTTGGPCTKWWCPTCGVKRLEMLLDQVREQIDGLEVVLLAEANYDEKVVGRVRSRHSNKPGSEYFWFRRDDGRIFYLSNVALDGGRSSDSPSTWLTATPKEAMEWLKTVVMVFPGYHDHGWSQGWWQPTPTLSEDEKGEDDKDFEDLNEKAEYRYFQINADQAAMVEERLRQEVRLRYGCDLDAVPRDKRGEVSELLEDLVKEVKASGFGASGGGGG